VTTPQPLQVLRRTTGGETEIELSLDVPSDLEYVGPAVELIADELPGGPLSPAASGSTSAPPSRKPSPNAIAYGTSATRRRVVRVELRWRATPSDCT